MRVSVALINYNYGRYLRGAIDSALDQTLAPFEVVVVDDGSTDESRRVLHSYSDQIVTVLTENRGPSAATNTALERCSGDVVCLLDADDLMLPRRVEALVEAYTAHPDCGWVFHGLDFVDRRTLTPLETPLRPGFTPGFHDKRRFVRWGWISMHAPATSALSWRLPFLRRLLPIPETESQDNYLKFASIGQAPGWVIAEPLSLQGIHDANRYTTTQGVDRRVASLRNGVGMLFGLDTIGLEMMAEHLAADAVVGALGRRGLGGDYTKILSSWAKGLSASRKLRFAAFCAAVGVEAIAEKARTTMATRR